MSSGVVHDRVTYICSPVIFCLGLIISWQVALVVTLSFLFAGLMFNGDLDIHSDVYKRWGPLRFLWLPYRKFGHRSKWTHGFLRGTLIRVLWVMWIPIVALSFCGIDVISFLRIYWEWVLWGLLGLELGSMSHTIMDLSSTGWKRLWK